MKIDFPKRLSETYIIEGFTYGFGVTILFAVIVVGWCICAIGSFRKLNAWGKKAAFGICGTMITLELIFPLLGGLGMVACLIPHPFSMDWLSTLLAVIPQLVVMLALLKTSHRKQQQGRATETKTLKQMKRFHNGELDKATADRLG